MRTSGTPKSQPPQGELVKLTDASPAERAQMARMKKTAKAIQIAPGLYVVGSQLDKKDVVRIHFYEIAASFWPGGVFVGKSALSANLKDNNEVFISHPNPSRLAPLILDGVTIIPVIGMGYLPGDATLPTGMSISGGARRLVENVTLAGYPPKWKAGKERVQDTIEEYVRTGGNEKIKKTLVELDSIARNFEASAVIYVKDLLVAVLGTVTSATPKTKSKRLAARLKNNPYDPARVESLTRLVKLLENKPPNPRPSFSPATRWEWLPFFEAYFSNFIEGTEFDIDEAYKIAIEDFVSPGRPKDSHDISATYRLTSNQSDNILIPTSGAELIEILRERHSIMMAARPEVNPGQFKTVANRVGTYHFVEPGSVIGTLIAGFDVVNPLESPMARAIAMTALVTECHPFIDGNGRISRMMSNSELSAKSQVRLIISTNQRDSYLTSLRAYSDVAVGGEPLYQVMNFAQKWAYETDWTEYAKTKTQLEKNGAFDIQGATQSIFDVVEKYGAH